MNKAELISTLSEAVDLPKIKTGEIIEAIVESITKALKTGDKVTLIGFGTFETVKRAARVGRNPKTGEEIKIKAATLPKFKAGKTLKESVAALKPKAAKK